MDADNQRPVQREVMDAMRQAFATTLAETALGAPLFFIIDVHGLTNEELKPMLAQLQEENPAYLFKLGFNTGVVVQVAITKVITTG
jgi:hypothetical protein